MLWRKLTSWDNLWASWAKVSARGDTPGVDGITLDDFARDLHDELTVLQTQLTGMLYAPLPVKKFVLSAEQGKQREIGILTVRDRIVHQAVMQVLAPLFEPHFQECSYAYRPGRSALRLVHDVEKQIRQGKPWALKIDIERFFDSMDHLLLLSELRTEVTDDQVLNLVEKCLKAHTFSYMSIREIEKGAVQGSALSPLLSNIYLNPFDRAALAGGRCYFRYSDDLLFLGTEKSEILSDADFARKNLALLKLTWHEEKTLMLDLRNDELTFVGYSFRMCGKAASKKAVLSWQQKIEAIVQDISLAFPEKQRKLDEFWTGWNNYYPREVEPSLPPVYLLVLRLNRALLTKDDAELDAVSTELLRVSLQRSGRSCHPALHVYSAQCWLELGDYFRALLELAQAQVRDSESSLLADTFQRHLLPKGIGPEIFELINELTEKMESDQEQILNAVDYFTERGWFFLSHSVLSYYQRLKTVSAQLNRENLAGITSGSGETSLTGDRNAVQLSDAEKELFIELFSGREGVYGKEEMIDGKRFYRPVSCPFSFEILEQHLRGEITAGLYIRRHNDTVKVLVIDLDISKKYLLQAAGDTAGMEKLMQQAHSVALRIQQVAADWELNCYLEDSGYRGRHCWFFLDSPLTSTTALDFFKKLRFAVGITEPAITWEYYPAREKFKPDHLGELIKLPYGIHGKTGRRGLFIQEEGTPFPNQGAILRTMKKCDAIKLAAIARGMKSPAEFEMKVAGILTVDAHSAATAGESGVQQCLREGSKNHELKRVEDRLRHLHPLVQGAPQLVRQVITHCELVRHLVFKSLETSYLSHRERFTLLCVFGHLGAGGKEYLHTVISYCMNYDQRTTERFIAKLPPKPVSCPRIREEYKELTAALGCDCVFPQRKSCYPSPVLHALTGKDTTTQLEQKITVPKLRSETAESDNRLQDEKERLQAINTITRKLISLRQHQNGITKSISACKRQLLEYFHEKNVERLPMELGTLVLVRTGEEADFIIEI